MITQKRLQDLFDYNPDTGRLERKLLGLGEKKITGGISKQGYLMRWVDKKCYPEHRLVWMYHYGEFPNEIDHINHVKTDNRLENLRDCGRTLNNGNHRKHGNNTSGYKGVSYSKITRKWWAQISFEKTHHNLGYYATPEEAALAYNTAAIEHFGEFAYLNEVS